MNSKPKYRHQDARVSQDSLINFQLTQQNMLSSWNKNNIKYELSTSKDELVYSDYQNDDDKSKEHLEQQKKEQKKENCLKQLNISDNFNEKKTLRKIKKDEINDKERSQKRKLRIKNLRNITQQQQNLDKQNDEEEYKLFKDNRSEMGQRQRKRDYKVKGLKEQKSGGNDKGWKVGLKWLQNGSSFFNKKVEKINLGVQDKELESKKRLQDGQNVHQYKNIEHLQINRLKKGDSRVMFRVKEKLSIEEIMRKAYSTERKHTIEK